MKDFYVFKDLNLLKEALTHSSYANENSERINNERLELLGDSVLSLAITAILLKLYPEDSEGQISQKRDNLVNESTLYNLAKKIKIEDSIYFGRGEELSGGRQKKRLVSSALEALIGAIYLDSDFETSKKVINSLFDDWLKNVSCENKKINYKDKLQQIVYKNNLSDPEFIINKTDGPDHNKKFYIDVFINGKCIATGFGNTKKLAEQEAAKTAIEKLEVSE